MSFYSKHNLHNKGWTDGMINKFLPAPIKLPNPVNPFGPDMCQWDQRLVDQMMETSEFQTHLKSIEKKRQAARNSACRREDQLPALVEEKIAEIEVEQVDFNMLRNQVLQEKMANRSKNHRPWNFIPALENEATINGWILDYILEHHTRYVPFLFRCKKVVCTVKYHVKYQRAVLDAISDAYPQLRETCKKRRYHRKYTINLAELKNRENINLNDYLYVPEP